SARKSILRAYELLLTVSPQKENELGQLSLATGTILGRINVHVSGDPRILQRFADVQLEKSNVEAGLCNRTAAIELVSSSIHSQRKLAADHPQDLGKQHGLAKRWLLLGQLESDLGMLDESLAFNREAQGLLATLSKQKLRMDDLPEYTRDLAHTYE